MIARSDRLEKVHSDIRGPIYEEALRMQASGEKVLRLNTGNPASFGFTLPDSVRKALGEHLDEAVAYCDMRGMPAARAAIARYHQGRGLKNVAPEDIFVCNGVSEAASMAMTALVSVGEEVLMPSPCYSLWSNNAYICAGKPVFYRCDPNNNWNPDPEDIASKVGKRTKAIVVINPNNPTGAVYSRETLLAIADIARKNGLVLLSDEIYDRLILDDIPNDSIAALAPDVPCITFNGLSKSHIICGFRCGWMAFSDQNGELDEVKAAVTQLASMRLCGNALTQLVIPAALDDADSTRRMLLPGGRLYEQRRATCDALAKIEGVHFVPNRAAFYLFPGVDRAMYDFESGHDLALQLLHENHVLVIPGEGFDWHEDIRVRVVMLPRAEVLSEAMTGFGAFLQRHRR